MWDWLTNLFNPSPTVYGGYQPPQGNSTWSNPLMWLSLASTGAGAYSAWNNANQAQNAYEANRRNADAYNRSITNWYDQMNAYNAQRMNMFRELMGGAMSAMSAPPISSYEPMSAAAAKARRRGITAQSALRTGGNEGGYVDNLVAEGMAGDELERYKASAQIDALLNQNRMMLWPAMLSAFAQMGGAPPAPIAPGYAPYPSNATSLGSTSAFGDFLKWQQQQDALEAQRAANEAWRRQWTNTTQGPSNMPRYSLYDPPMYDYEGPY